MAFIPHCLKLFQSIDLEVKAFGFPPEFASLWLQKQIFKLSKHQESYFYRPSEIMQQKIFPLQVLVQIMVLLDGQVTSAFCLCAPPDKQERYSHKDWTWNGGNIVKKQPERSWLLSSMGSKWPELSTSPSVSTCQ